MTEEFPEAKVSTPDLVEDVLRETFFKLEGYEPDVGGYYPSEKVVASLESIFESRDELIDFLKMSMALHVWMGKQKGAEQVPFFVNKLLLSEKRANMLDKYIDFLRERYGSKLEGLKSFSSDVFADCITVENDYWWLAAAWHMHGDVPNLDFITPTVSWGIGSALMRRFRGLEKKHGCPVVFARKEITYEGKVMAYEEAWALEVRACEKSQKRENLLVERFCAAVTDVRVGWAGKVGLIQVYKDEFGRTQTKNKSGVNLELLSIQDGDDMFEKDKSLFKFAKKWLSDNGVTFNKPEEFKMKKQEAPKEDVVVEEKDDGFKLLSKKSLNPALKGLLDA